MLLGAASLAACGGGAPDAAEVAGAVPAQSGHVPDVSTPTIPELQMQSLSVDQRLALMSGHFNVDLTRFDVDMPISKLVGLDVTGTKGMFETYSRQNPNITLRDIAGSYLSGSDDNAMAGTPDQIADYMMHLIDEGGGDGFQITPAYYAPQFFDDIVDKLIPVLQKRGVFRSEYEGNTLRDYMTK